MPGRKPIAIGTRFARLVVIGPAEPTFTPGGIRLYRVQVKCDCGTIKDYQENWLRHKRVMSCGCLNKEQMDARRFKHGQAEPRTSTYQTWDAMVQRCTNPNSKAFKDYGGRGITICDPWMTFANFFKDMGERPTGLTLERKDNDLGYSKDNCVWATRKQQQQNRRACKIVEFQGIKGCLMKVCEHFGASYKAALYRLKAGWTIEAALLAKKHSRKPKTPNEVPREPQH